MSVITVTKTMPIVSIKHNDGASSIGEEYNISMEEKTGFMILTHNLSNGMNPLRIRMLPLEAAHIGETMVNYANELLDKKSLE